MNHAVICELNPLHAGHVYLFERIRRFDPDAVIVCIMSGFFVQRGEAAIFDKFSRGKTAVENGADLVLELPLPFCMTSAQSFAEAAVDIADRLSEIDYLWFGSECGDIKLLEKTADDLMTGVFKSALNDSIKTDRKKSYAESFSSVYSELFGSDRVLREPNNLLAIEYIRALKERSSKIIPKTIKRIDCTPNNSLSGNIYHSSIIREQIIKELTDNKSTSSTNAASAEFNERWIISKVREAAYNNTISTFQYCASIEDRIKKAVISARSLNELYESIKTKSITMSRIRRAILSIVLGIKESYGEPDFTCLLAADRKGTGFLSKTRTTRSINIITKPAKLCELAGTSLQADLNLKAQSIYTLFMYEPQAPGYFLKMTPYIIE